MSLLNASEEQQILIFPRAARTALWNPKSNVTD
jgi:hypothetical protein